MAEFGFPDAQPQTFEQAQASAVEEFGLELEGGVGVWARATWASAFVNTTTKRFCFGARRS